MTDTIILEIPGDPVTIFKEDHGYPEVRSSYLDKRGRSTVYLENQWNEKELISTPIDITINFFISYKFPRKEVASIVELFRFINQVATGTIYKKENLLRDVKLKKIYCNKPRTEIIIKGQL